MAAMEGPCNVCLVEKWLCLVRSNTLWIWFVRESLGFFGFCDLGRWHCVFQYGSNLGSLSSNTLKISEELVHCIVRSMGFVVHESTKKESLILWTYSRIFSAAFFFFFSCLFNCKVEVVVWIESNTCSDSLLASGLEQRVYFIL